MITLPCEQAFKFHQTNWKKKSYPSFIQCLQEFPESSEGIYKQNVQKKRKKREKITVKRGSVKPHGLIARKKEEAISDPPDINLNQVP